MTASRLKEGNVVGEVTGAIRLSKYCVVNLDLVVRWDPYNYPFTLTLSANLDIVESEVVHLLLLTNTYARARHGQYIEADNKSFVNT